MIISGKSIFKFMETKGLPLEFVLMSLKEKDFLIDWIEFIQISIDNNWKLKGTLIKVENSLYDVYGKNEYTKKIIGRLNDYFN
jgi:hypothetical protein